MAGRLCPWWVGYIMASPLRRFFENPRKILGDYVKPGMTILDAGCAMGFFTLWMADKVGPEGKIVGVDLQERMIESLRRRAARRGLRERIDARLCSADNLKIDDLAGKVDFAIAFHVVHEVEDVPRFMTEIHAALKPDTNFYVVEPRGHASVEDFAATEAAARQAGFAVVDHPEVKGNRTAMFVKKT